MSTTSTTTLPVGVTIRTPRMEDAQGAYDLLAACDMADHGMLSLTLQDLRDYWRAPETNLETDVWLVSNDEGQIIGYADTGHRLHVAIFSDIRVHPQYRNQGIENALMRLAEERARQHIAEAPAHARVALNSWNAHCNSDQALLFERAGYSMIRQSWRMRIEMNEAPPAPELPAHVTIRTFIPEQDARAVFDADDEAFRDHWGYLPDTFEHWEYWTVKREGFDPSLWFLAVEGNEIAGIALCRFENMDGWVDTLAVRRPWRKLGVGLALLRQAFGEFYKRGTRTVGLGVDAQNLTGATRLYIRAGMHVALQHDTYQKELRPGVELSTQSVSE
ncbi:MAG TPA: GNAT family N-acetyltransferase [Ktedonobacteraceae bacterium]|nr:GNAT family N-acetyltransferase [Ktedonobacteraceae bacterium]